MKYQINIQWRDYQKDVIKNIMDSALGTTHCVLSPRQC